MKTMYKTGLAALLVSACATTERVPPPEAVTSLPVREDCTADFDLAGAISLTPEEPTGAKTALNALSDTSLCRLEGDEGYQLYSIFALPETGQIASIAAGSRFEIKRILGPEIIVLDAAGSEIAHYDASEMVQRGRGLSVLFRPATDAEYVVIATDRDLIGSGFALAKTDRDPDSRSPYPVNGVSDATMADLIKVHTQAYSLHGVGFINVYFADPAGASPNS